SGDPFGIILLQIGCAETLRHIMETTFLKKGFRRMTWLASNGLGQPESGQKRVSGNKGRTTTGTGSHCSALSAMRISGDQRSSRCDPRKPERIYGRRWKAKLTVLFATGAKDVVSGNIREKPSLIQGKGAGRLVKKAL